MSLPRYESYKDSGIEWLGEVPSHWEIKPVKNLVKIVNGYPFDSKFFHSTDGYPLVRIRDLNSSDTHAYYNGEFVVSAAITSNDILIGMDGDFNVGRWRGAGKALLNQRMCCIRGNNENITRILEYALPFPLKAINEVTYSTTVKHLSSGQVEKTFVVIPPDEKEQATIAAFLDHETAKIDELIAEQQRLVELLKEKRQAVISHAVTKGLNPAAPMKDSGIEWLGEVPSHWAVVRLSYYTDIENGTTPSKDNLDYWSEGNIPWLASGEVNQYRVIEANEYITKEALQKCSLRLLPKGTIVVGMIGQGKTRGMSALLEIEASINQNLAAIIPSNSLDSEYVLYIFQSMYEYLREFGRGGNQAALNCEILSALSVPLPPLSEQIHIASFITHETAKIDELTTEAKRAITFLQERRTALISAAVTGKIDVRGVELQPERTEVK